MKPEYLNNIYLELLEDKQFIAWVLRGDNNKKWEVFLKNNPGIVSEVMKAREAILLLRDSYENLDEKATLEIWNNIETFDKLYRNKIRRLNIIRNIGRAASVLLILSLGIFGYIYVNDKSKEYHLTTIQTVNTSEKARLVLTNGDQVVLKNDRSVININDQNELVIENDSVIDLSVKPNKSNDKVEMNEIIVPYGKKSELELADGTKIWLNAGSSLAFPSEFTQKTREVYLKGEACFKVAHNYLKPFVVKTGKLDIKVLGTWFNVSAYDSDENIETVLLDGSIAMQKPTMLNLGKSEVILKPGQKADFLKAENELKVTDVPDVYAAVSWTEGWLQFSRENLSSVLTKLERYYNKKFIIHDNFSSSELINGKLELKDTLEEVLIVLSDVAKIEYKITSDEIYIFKE